MPQSLGLYLHIPFCVQKCRYCDFCSAPANESTKAAYTDALCTHLAALAPHVRDYTVDTVYVGGGTPTALDPHALSRIMRTVRDRFALTPDAEISMECNPVTSSEGLFDTLLTAGVNRLSIGAQSMHDTELALLGRPHTAKDLERTLLAARRAGFDNISADVMFGIPAQTVDSFKNTLAALVSLSPDHISAYGLRIEQGTPFYRERHTLPLPTEDEEADMAALVASFLPQHGYERYEISNYARNGARSRHNMRYWLREEYLGVGPAAHSFLRGERFSMLPDTSAYIRHVAAGELDALVRDRTRVSAHEAREEYTMLRMRTREGVERRDFRARFGIGFENAYGDIAHLVRGGFLIDDPDRVAFTDRGFQVSNAILSEWLDFGGDA